MIPVVITTVVNAPYVVTSRRQSSFMRSNRIHASWCPVRFQFVPLRHRRFGTACVLACVARRSRRRPSVLSITDSFIRSVGRRASRYNEIVSESMHEISPLCFNQRRRRERWMDGWTDCKCSWCCSYKTGGYIFVYIYTARACA